MGKQNNSSNERDNADMAATATGKIIQFLGVRVDRESFLHTQFKNESAELQRAIVEQGPVGAGIAQEDAAATTRGLDGWNVWNGSG